MKEILKKMMTGTVLEPLARRLYAALTGKRHDVTVVAESSGNEGVFDPESRDHQYNLQTREVMRRILRDDSNCIDVGCHQGCILTDILQFAPKGTHFAFEPIPGMYQDLLKSFGKHNNLHLYDCALCDSEGTTTFQHVVTNPGYSGLRQRRYDRPHEDVEEIVVKTNLLDNLIPASVPIQFIKVDVEGAELQVFRGAVETIRSNRPVIVFEHGLGAADCYGTAPEHIYDVLAGQCGLRLFLMAEWLASDGRNFLDREAFCEQFTSGKNFYFMAAP
jgi:FkbM family methyltransferase